MLWLLKCFPILLLGIPLSRPLLLTLISTFRMVKNHIKRFSQAYTTRPPTSPAAYPHLDSPRFTSPLASPLASPLSLPLSNLSLPFPSLSSPRADSKPTWDFTSGRSILEVQPSNLDDEELPVEGFTIEETREYFAKYLSFSLFLSVSL